MEWHGLLEELIDETPFFAGERPTLADGLLIGVARWLDFHGVAAEPSAVCRGPIALYDLIVRFGI